MYRYVAPAFYNSRMIISMELSLPFSTRSIYGQCLNYVIFIGKQNKHFMGLVSLKLSCLRLQLLQNMHEANKYKKI